MTGGAALHHVELWVPDLAAAEASWGWLFGSLG
jgi:catechol 2,3-dioxygenase-like lactoylglutathione lyase family enzyme